MEDSEEENSGLEEVDETGGGLKEEVWRDEGNDIKKKDLHGKQKELKQWQQQKNQQKKQQHLKAVETKTEEEGEVAVNVLLQVDERRGR